MNPTHLCAPHLLRLVLSALAVVGMSGAVVACSQETAFRDGLNAVTIPPADNRGAAGEADARAAACENTPNECPPASDQVTSVSSEPIPTTTTVPPPGPRDNTTDWPMPTITPHEETQSSASTPFPDETPAPAAEPTPGTTPAPLPTPGPIATPVETPTASPTAIPSPNPTPVVTPTPSVIVIPDTTPTPASTPHAGEWQTLEIDQPQRGKTDILWVIDNSSSMKWAQDALAAKFANFAAELLKANLDFHLGITSTDVCQDNDELDAYCPRGNLMGTKSSRGKLVPIDGGKRYLTESSKGLVEKFAAAAILGTNGSSAEQGLSAAKMAVALSLPGKTNNGFLRSDASLSIIVLSDEEDDGVGFWAEDGHGNPAAGDYFGNVSYAKSKDYTDTYDFSEQHMRASRFVTELSNLKGPGKLQVNAIVGMLNSEGSTRCGVDSKGTDIGPKEVGSNYIVASQTTGGVAENICGDWGAMLSRIGKSTVELTTRIPLGKEPLPGTLEVRVDGTVWSSGWEYDRGSHAIVFKTFPPYGSHVAVRFRELLK